MKIDGHAHWGRWSERWFPDLESDLAVHAAIARQMGLRGVLIGRVLEGTGAEDAGLRGTREGRRGQLVLGDVIVAINDTPIDELGDLLGTLNTYSVGDRVQVTFIRDDVRRTITVELGGPG